MLQYLAMSYIGGWQIALFLIFIFILILLRIEKDQRDLETDNLPDIKETDIPKVPDDPTMDLAYLPPLSIKGEEDERERQRIAREWVRDQLNMLIGHYSEGPILEHSLLILLKAFTIEYPSKVLVQGSQVKVMEDYLGAMLIFLDLTRKTAEKIPHHPQLKQFEIFLLASVERIQASVVIPK